MVLPFLLLSTVIGLVLYSKDVGMNDTVNNSYDGLFQKYGAQYGINWKFIKRIAWIESKIGMYRSVRDGISNPGDVAKSASQDGKSWGIMQVTIPTARDYDKLATPEKMNNPEYSIKIGTQHLAMLKKRYFSSSDRDLAMAYNHGQGNQLKFIEAEKNKTLKISDYRAGREYYAHYLKAKELIP